MVPLGLGVGPTGLRVLTREKGFACMQHESDIQATCAYCHIYFSVKKIYIRYQPKGTYQSLTMRPKADKKDVHI